MSVEVLIWGPGDVPASASGQRPTYQGEFFLIDAQDASLEELVSAVAPLALPGLLEPALRFLRSGVSPDDPGADRMADIWDSHTADQLRSGTSLALLHANEPVLVKFADARPERWSYVAAPLALLAGNDWLITYRGTPFDTRWGARYDELPPMRRARLIEAASDFTRVDQKARDVATMIVRMVARRHLEVQVEIGDEISNRMLLLHRDLIESNQTATSAEDKIREELFDLRWVLDSNERRMRRLDPRLSPQASTWFAGVSDAGRHVEKETLRLIEQTTAQIRQDRAALGDAMTSLAAASQASLERQGRRLQDIVARLTIYVLGPTLVATALGALPAIFDKSDALRALTMGVLMVAAGAFVWVLFRDQLRDGEAIPSETSAVSRLTSRPRQGASMIAAATLLAALVVAIVVAR